MWWTVKDGTLILVLLFPHLWFQIKKNLTEKVFSPSRELLVPVWSKLEKSFFMSVQHPDMMNLECEYRPADGWIVCLFQCSFPNSDPLPYSRVRPHQYTVSKKQKSLLLTHLPIRWTQRSSSSIIVVCLGRQSQSNTRNSHTVLVSTKLPWESTYIYIK